MKKWGWPWARGAPLNFGFPIIFLQRLRLVTSNLARSWGLPRPIIKSHAEEKVGVDLGSRFGTQLGFAKAHHKITPRGKVVVASG